MTETPDTTAEVEAVDHLRPDEPPSDAAYRAGCRCRGCRDARATYMRGWRARRRDAGMASSYAGADADRPRGRTTDRPAA